MNKNRYLLFCGEQYYPSGGFDDFVGAAETIEEVKKLNRGSWYHIVDIETLKIVEESG